MTPRKKKPLTVGDLEDAAYNPRTMDATAHGRLDRSMRKFGDLSGLVFNRRTKRLIGGHQRKKHIPPETPVEVVRSWKKPNDQGTVAIGYVDVEGERWSYREVDVDEATEKAMNIAANRHQGEWDTPKLEEMLKELQAGGTDMELTGFTPDELLRYTGEGGTGNTDPDDAPPAPVTPVTERGDVWLLGRHRLVCGDSTNPEDVKRALAGIVPAIMVTDPPYGVDYDPEWRLRAGLGSEGQARGKVQNDGRADWTPAWALFPGPVVYVWHSSLRAPEVMEGLAHCGFDLRAQIVWVKNRPVVSRGHYHWQHETVLYGVRGPEDGWNPEESAVGSYTVRSGEEKAGKSRKEPEDAGGPRFRQDHEVAAYAVKKGSTASWEGGRRQSTVWFIEHHKSETGHGTQKPVECMARPISNNTSPGQAVYDPFVGSGTTIIAAEMLGRACQALELDPAYVDVAVLRWEAFTGEKAVLEGTEKGIKELSDERHPKKKKRTRKKKAAKA